MRIKYSAYAAPWYIRWGFRIVGALVTILVILLSILVWALTGAMLEVMDAIFMNGV